MDRWIRENINREICQIANSRKFSDAKISQYTVKQVDFEKMSRHCIQWLLACNLLSNFVCTFKNVAEGYIMQRMQIWVGLYSQYNASLPGHLSLFSISFLFCMGMTTIQLQLRTWFGVLASCARHTELSQPSQRRIRR